MAMPGWVVSRAASLGTSHFSATASTEMIRTRRGWRRWRSETPWTSASMCCISLRWVWPRGLSSTLLCLRSKSGASGSDLELDWPTTCVQLNDIVEGHLGNQGNVFIYQNTFGDQAEAACQNDHRDDVRSVFAWAIGGATPSAPGALELTVTSAEVPADLPAYDRDEWGRWSDADGDCQDTRQEVLIAESLVPVNYKTVRQCGVASGEWFGAFTGSTGDEPGALDIDHLVPLANAHRSGAWAWPEARKRAYYNSLDDVDHLIAVTASANRSKGARGPDEWLPPNESYWCEYGQDWIRIKQAWGLSVTSAEAQALEEMLARCEAPTILTISSN